MSDDHDTKTNTNPTTLISSSNNNNNDETIDMTTTQNQSLTKVPVLVQLSNRTTQKGKQPQRDDDTTSTTTSRNSSRSNSPRILEELQSQPQQDDDNNNNHKTKNDGTRLELQVGENWLRLHPRIKQKMRSVLDETQDDGSSTASTAARQIPFPVLLGSETGFDTSTLPTVSCFVVVDVDDSGVDDADRKYQLAVKDMRPLIATNNHSNKDPPKNNDGTTDDEDDEHENENDKIAFELCLARRIVTVVEPLAKDGDNDPTTKSNSTTAKDDKEPNKNGSSLWAGYSPLECLPRRQLRILQPGDRLCTRSLTTTNNKDLNNHDPNNSDDDFLSRVGLVLEYRLLVPLPNTNSNAPSSASAPSSSSHGTPASQKSAEQLLTSPPRSASQPPFETQMSIIQPAGEDDSDSEATTVGDGDNNYNDNDDNNSESKLEATAQLSILATQEEEDDDNDNNDKKNDGDPMIPLGQPTMDSEESENNNDNKDKSMEIDQDNNDEKGNNNVNKNYNAAVADIPITQPTSPKGNDKNKKDDDYDYDSDTTVGETMPSNNGEKDNIEAKSKQDQSTTRKDVDEEEEEEEEKKSKAPETLSNSDNADTNPTESPSRSATESGKETEQKDGDEVKVKAKAKPDDMDNDDDDKDDDDATTIGSADDKANDEAKGGEEEAKHEHDDDGIALPSNDSPDETEALVDQPATKASNEKQEHENNDKKVSTPLKQSDVGGGGGDNDDDATAEAEDDASQDPAADKKEEEQQQDESNKKNAKKTISKKPVKKAAGKKGKAKKKGKKEVESLLPESTRIGLKGATRVFAIDDDSSGKEAEEEKDDDEQTENNVDLTAARPRRSTRGRGRQNSQHATEETAAGVEHPFLSEEEKKLSPGRKLKTYGSRQRSLSNSSRKSLDNKDEIGAPASSPSKEKGTNENAKKESTPEKQGEKRKRSDGLESEEKRDEEDGENENTTNTKTATDEDEMASENGTPAALPGTRVRGADTQEVASVMVGMNLGDTTPPSRPSKRIRANNQKMPDMEKTQDKAERTTPEGERVTGDWDDDVDTDAKALGNNAAKESKKTAAGNSILDQINEDEKKLGLSPGKGKKSKTRAAAGTRGQKKKTEKETEQVTRTKKRPIENLQKIEEDSFEDHIPQMERKSAPSPAESEVSDPAAAGRKRRKAKREQNQDVSPDSSPEKPVAESSTERDEPTTKNSTESPAKDAEEPFNKSDATPSSKVELETLASTNDSATTSVNDALTSPGEEGKRETVGKRSTRSDVTTPIDTVEETETETKTKKKSRMASKTPNKKAEETAAKTTVNTPARSTRKRKAASRTPEQLDDSEKQSPKQQPNSEESKANDNEDQRISIMTTGVTLSRAQLSIIKRLGGEVLDDIKDAHRATHIIASEKGQSMRRTAKLMVGMCSTRNIVSLAWLMQSGRAKQALPVDNFLLVNDKKAEEMYNFSMQDSLARAAEMRKEGTKLFDGWSIHVCKGVAGKKAPPEEEMKAIVEQAGGAWIPTLSQKVLGELDLSRLIVITSDPETKQQISAKPVKEALNNGAKKQTTSSLFGCIMRQIVEFD